MLKETGLFYTKGHFLRVVSFARIYHLRLLMFFTESQFFTSDSFVRVSISHRATFAQRIIFEQLTCLSHRCNCHAAHQVGRRSHLLTKTSGNSNSKSPLQSFSTALQNDRRNRLSISLNYI